MVTKLQEGKGRILGFISCSKKCILDKEPSSGTLKEYSYLKIVQLNKFSLCQILTKINFTFLREKN